MKMPWKKNFRKIPDNILIKLEKMNTSDILVSCAKKLNKQDVEKGIYSHLGIEFKNGEIFFKKALIPLFNIGRYSNYNINGRLIKLKNLPMINELFTIEAPNWNGSGTHDVDRYIDTYQREYWLPKYININIEKLNEDEESINFKFALDTILTKGNPCFNEELLFHLNLLQENCGLSDVFEANANDSEYIKTLFVDWELLPPGESNFDSNIEILMKKYRSNDPDIKKTMIERMEFFECLKPLTYICGTNRFNRYFGAKFKDDIVLLENLNYGNAIYIMYEDWENLSKLSRIELLISSNKNFTRIIHTTNWKNNVLKAIEHA